MHITKSRFRDTGCFALMVWTLAAGCTHLVYQPTDLMYLKNPETVKNLRKEVSFSSSDGVKLSGWWFPARRGGHKGTVVQFHGNAQNLTSHFASVFWMVDEGYDLFSWDYRGYGISEGKPNPEGVNRDAQAALEYVAQQSQGPLIPYGQSLGGAILLRAMDDLSPQVKKRVQTVVIESSFDNYHSIARDVLSRSWVTFLFQPLAYVLVSNSYGPGDSISRLSPTPLLVIHGTRDTIVPYYLGERIYERAKEPKRLIRVDGGGHINSMEFESGRYRAELLKFLSET